MAVIEKAKLPHNIEAEKAVLGAMLRSTTCLHDASGRIKVEDFYDEKNKLIFKAMQRLYKDNGAIDAQTVVNELNNSNNLEFVGGLQYLLELADAVITFSNVPEYISNIRDTAILRQFLETLDDIQKDYIKGNAEDPNEFLNIAETKINRVTETRSVADFRQAKEIAQSLARELETLKPSESDDQVTGIPTGYPRLNRFTHGFQKGNYIVVAARPGIGKTTFCLNLAYNAASRGIPVAYFSLEMRAEDLFKRLVSAQSDILFNTLQSGYNLDRSKRMRLIETCENIGKLKFYVEDSSGVGSIELLAKIKKLKAQEPDLQLVFIDYIGLVKATVTRGNESRTLQIQEISTSLKRLALELNISIVCVAQLNRKVEERGGDPMLSDLRESGSLEQDADIVLLLAEAKMPASKKRGRKDDEDAPEAINTAYDNITAKAGGAGTMIINVNIAKNRSGQQGQVPLLFRKGFAKFDPPTEELEREILAINSSKSSFLGTE